MAATLRSALDAARPCRVVYFINHRRTGDSIEPANAAHHHRARAWMVVDAITFLRPGWFMENSIWDVAPATRNGVIPSFLQPLDKPVPMVATADVGRLAADLLQETWTGHRVVEFGRAKSRDPNEIAATLHRTARQAGENGSRAGRNLGIAVLIARHEEPHTRIPNADGFNEGWIEFERGEAGSRKGKVALETVLQTLIERETKSSVLQITSRFANW